LVQIRHSNGTQGGKGLAILGILLSLALAGSVAAANIVDWSRQHEDEAKVNQVLDQLGKYVAAGEYDKAYQFFSPDFQGILKPDVFKVQLQQYQQYFGKIEGMSSNDRFLFLPTTEGIPTAQTQAMVRFQKPTTNTTQPTGSLEPRRVPTALFKINGQWRIGNMEIFHKP